MARTAKWSLILAGAALMACGSLADGSKAEPIATVSGALSTGVAPSGAHVALVYRKGEGGGYAVTEDVPLTGDRFEMVLQGPPPDDFFLPASALSAPGAGSGSGASGGASAEPGSSSSGGGGGTGPASPASPTSPSSPPPGTGAGAPPIQDAGVLSTKATEVSSSVVGGTVSQPMVVAIAGFVIYVDGNGNGALDLQGTEASSPDTIVGGSAELALVYLRGGASLAYEKLRDRTGRVPSKGYNLAWSEGGRFLPLDAVELELAKGTKLPGLVCAGATATPLPAPPPTGGGGSAGGGGTPSSAPSGSIVCSADNRSYTYSDCPAAPASKEGLCSSSVDVPACSGGGVGLPEGAPFPSGWPCPVATDAGAAPVPAPADAAAPTTTVSDAGVPAKGF